MTKNEIIELEITALSSDGNGVSWPMWPATTWSSDVGDGPLPGAAHVSHTCDERAWLAPAEASEP